MPVITAEAANEMLSTMIEAAGTPRDIATCVAAHLVDASLKGVDSHGVMRIVMYLDQIAKGRIVPDARPEVVQETASTALVRGHLGFGFHAMEYAVSLAIAKARATGVAAVGLAETTHTGRLGRYGEIMAEQGMLGIVAGGGHSGTATSGRWVAPHGGARRALSTNPYVLAMPGGRFGPVVVDIATSTVGEGKLQVYRAKHEPLPPGWILDKDGRPSTDVEDFYAGGMLLPAAGHKGYGLSLIAELLGSALLGAAHIMNWFILVTSLTAFRDPESYEATADSILAGLKAIPPAEGFNEVMIPGEPEMRTAESRARTGIPIPEAMWVNMVDAAQRVGVDAQAYLAGHLE